MTTVEQSDPAGYQDSPFADAVLTARYTVAPTGRLGDRAAPNPGGPPAFAEVRRPVVQIGKRLPTLVGRTAQIDELVTQLQQGRDVEVFAADGFGKTSLLNLLLHERPAIRNYFPDGVVSVWGSTLTTGELLSRLVSTFYRSDPVVVADRSEQLRLLSSVQALIILDDVEIETGELQQVIAGLDAPVFVVTSQRRRLPDLDGQPVGPLEFDETVTLVERRLGRTLSDADRDRVSALSDLLGHRPRSLARAIGLVQFDAVEVKELLANLSIAADPESEATRLAFTRASGPAATIVRILAELGGAAIGAQLLERLSGADADALAAELEQRGLGIVQGDRVALPADVGPAVRSIPTRGADATGDALTDVVEWAEHATDAAVVDEAAAIDAFSRWGVRNGRGADVVRLGRRADRALAAAGNWAAAAAVLTSVTQAGVATEQAWALHQLGVRELAVGDPAAKAHLKEAKRLRTKLGERDAAKLTREHLGLLRMATFAAIPIAAKVAAGALFVGLAAVGVGLVTRDSDPPESAAPPLSSAAAATTTTVLPPEPVEPSVASFGRSAVLTWAWLDSDDTDSIVEIRRDGAVVQKVPGAAAQYVDFGLLPGTTYAYDVRVTRAELSSDWSTPVRVTIAADAGEGPLDLSPPTPPTGVKVTLVGSTATLAWNASLDDIAVTGYDVYRNDVLIAQGVTELTYRDRRLPSTPRLEYWVTALDAAGNRSTPSPRARLDVPVETTTTVAATEGSTEPPTATDGPSTTGSAAASSAPPAATVGPTVSLLTPPTPPSSPGSTTPPSSFGPTTSPSSAGPTTAAPTTAAPTTTPSTTTTTSTTTTAPAPPPPATPTGLTAGWDSIIGSYLSWDTPSDDVASYEIYRDGVGVASFTYQGSPFYEFGSDPACAPVRYTVKAVNSNGVRSAGSASVTFDSYCS